MATNLPISLPFPSTSKSGSHFSQNTQNYSMLFTSLTLSKPPRQTIHFRKPVGRNYRKKSLYWKTFTIQEVLPSDSTQQIVSSTGDDGVATIIQALLFVALVALTILTIGVIYIGVQDFMEKREREKLEKEEGAEKRNGKKKMKKLTTRDGPRGFGQKFDKDEDDDDDV